MQPGWCLICGATSKREFARKGADRVARRLNGQIGTALSYVICRDCGHVYQDPMLDEKDLTTLYDDDYRPFFASEQETAKELERGRKFCEELAPLVESLVKGRLVLDIGCGSGCFLQAFKERGWEVFGIDPVPTWTDYVRRLVGGTEQTIVTGCYGPQVFPGRKFSLIVFSHTIEHLPDPVPMLQAMRNHLSDEGLLFVATPDLLNPPVADGLFKGFLSGAHVRLYSSASLKTVLARSGFRVKAALHYKASFGMGALAQPDAGGAGQGASPADDAEAIQGLFLALQQPKAAGTLGRNLAALLRSQPVVLPALCRKTQEERLRVKYWGDSLVAIHGIGEQGEDIPLVSWEGPGEGSVEQVERPGGQLSIEADTIVLLGLGSGAEARHLAGTLTGRQHLIIWEADPALAKAILRQVDLTELWTSGRVTLLLGERPIVPVEQQARLKSPMVLYRTDAARHWKEPVYWLIALKLGYGATSPDQAGALISAG